MHRTLPLCSTKVIIRHSHVMILLKACRLGMHVLSFRDLQVTISSDLGGLAGRLRPMGRPDRATQGY